MKATLILGGSLLLIAVAVLIGLRAVKAKRLWPVGMLIVTAPLEVYRTSSSAGGNLSLFRLALLCALAALGVDLLRRRIRFPSTVALPFAIYALLVAWQVTSLIFVTDNHSLAMKFIGQYSSGLVAAFIITCYVTRSDLRLVLGLFAGASVLPLLGAAYRVFSVNHGGSGNLPGLSELPLNLTIEAARQGGSTLLNGTQRFNSTFADANQFGFYAATAFLVLAGGALGALRARRPLSSVSFVTYLLLSVACALAVVGSYSRSAWLLTVIGVAAFALLLGRSFWTRRRVTVAAVACVLSAAAASPFAAVERLGSSEPGNIKSTQVHAHTMRIAIHLLEKHPALGVGLGGYGRYANEPPIISSATSTYLTVGAELGALGLLALVAAIATAAVAAVRTVLASTAPERPRLAGFVAAYLGLAAANAVGEIWMNDFQWVLFGALLAMTAQVRIRWLPRASRQAGGGEPKPQIPLAA